MKRPLRLSLRILAGVAVLAAVAASLCLDAVDNRPYFREGYYTQTTRELRDRARTNRLVRGELTAGFGRVRLSPRVHAAQDAPAQGEFRVLPLAGYGSRKGRAATGVHDDLYIKAVALEVQGRLGVLVGIDALILPREVEEAAAQRLQQESGITREQLYLSATHTHSSLGGWGEGVVAEAFAGPFQPGARAWFADCIVRAVQEAVKDLRPARFGQGHFPAPQFVRNRLVGELGAVDPDFSFAIVEQDSRRRAIIGVYGAHATVLSGDMMEFSADYPGCWQRAVEEASGGLAVFLAGAVGSQSPVPGAGGVPGTERMGQELARMTLEQMRLTPLTNSVIFGMIGLNVTMPPLNVRLSDGLRLRPWLARQLVPAHPQSFLQVFRVNDTVWISTPCDFSGELAIGIKDFLRARGTDATITSFNGDYVGYVIPSRYYHLDGYEPRTMSFFGPNVPDYFCDLIRSMALALVENRETSAAAVSATQSDSHKPTAPSLRGF